MIVVILTIALTWALALAAVLTALALLAELEEWPGLSATKRRRVVRKIAIATVFAVGTLYGAAFTTQALAAGPWQKATASWYGPGLFGNRTACGQTLHEGTAGVAHKTLRCGTRIEFFYRGRRTTVRVIDRGPYVAGRDFDLTAATRRRLGFPNGVAQIRWRPAPKPRSPLR